MKTVIWGFHHKNVEEACILGCCTMWLGNLSSKFQKRKKKNILPSSSGLCVHPRGYESIRGVITLKTKVACSFETSRSSYPTQRHKNPEDLLPQYKNRFATNKIFSTVSFPVGKQQPSCTTLVVSYAVVFSLSLVTYITKS